MVFQSNKRLSFSDGIDAVRQIYLLFNMFIALIIFLSADLSVLSLYIEFPNICS